MPYDIDGAEVGFRNGGGGITAVFANGIASWLTSGSKVNLNREDRQQAWGYGNGGASCFWFFFPESREVSYLALQFALGQLPEYNQNYFQIMGSADTANGMDGAWETAAYTAQYSYAADAWRSKVFAVSFSGPIKVLRVGVYVGVSVTGAVNHIHVYGAKAAGEQPDDIVFCDAAGNELTALTDWGDQPEGTTEIGSFKVKNASAGKIANTINLQLNHPDFTFAWSADGPWVTVLDIASLGVGALSNTVYVKNALGPPLLILGPYAARVIATVGSWT
jgi:hypothetical protein